EITSNSRAEWTINKPSGGSELGQKRLVSIGHSYGHRTARVTPPAAASLSMTTPLWHRGLEVAVRFEDPLLELPTVRTFHEPVRICPSGRRTAVSRTFVLPEFAIVREIRDIVAAVSPTPVSHGPPQQPQTASQACGHVNDLAHPSDRLNC